MQADSTTDLLVLEEATDGRRHWAFARSVGAEDGGMTMPALRVSGADGKGMGAFATRDISAGERLIAEAPLARWSTRRDESSEGKLQTFEHMVACLTPAQHDAILTLSQDAMHGTARSMLGTWLTNALPINYDCATEQQLEEAAVFTTISRLNHACAPNCHHEWNGRLDMETVHALRSISRGEELTICCGPPHLSNACPQPPRPQAV